MKNPLIGIIGGAGKMGTYFQRFFNVLGYTVLISDQDTDFSNRDIAQQVDVLIISVPIDQTIQVIREIVPFVKKSTLLMDFTSLKVDPVREMLKSKAEVIGCHPIFGPFSGMKNQVVVLCPVRSKKWVSWLKKIIKTGGGIIKILTPVEHDKLMAVVQVLTHFSDITLAHALKKLGIPLNEFLECQSPPYRLKLDMMGRILAQSSNLYGNILLKNPDRINVIKTYLNSQKELLKIAKKQDLKKFTQYFEIGANYLGEFKYKAMRESNFLIDKLNQFIKINRKQTKPKKLDLAVLGPANTYTDIAAQKYDNNLNRFYCQSISEVFKRVKLGEVSEGIVPIENIDQGAIRETLDELFQSEIYIKKEVYLPINHCLVAINGSNIRKIKIVLSKEQALHQCSIFLQDNLKKANIIYTSSTAEAMQKIIQDNLEEAAAIGDKTAAKKLNLKILRENIGNNPHNQTRFMVISRQKSIIKSNKNLKTSIALYFHKDRSGSLYSILGEFAQEKINLTSIETRPTGDKFGEYIFYIDFKGSLYDKNVKRCFNKIRKKVAGLKIFGSYEVLY